mmetsp:Transcript_16793/g.32732  ORF Transcript_16793/g.32732 Transcript_16793/m.32732 type:complete len:427 (-) Transcript_16793:547-1827(-)
MATKALTSNSPRRAHMKRTRDLEGDSAGPKSKRCTNCTSTESVDMCESIFHEPARVATKVELNSSPVSSVTTDASSMQQHQQRQQFQQHQHQQNQVKDQKVQDNANNFDDTNSVAGASVSGGAAKGRGRRLVWNERMHVKFLSIIFDIGLEHASPRKILDRWGLFERGNLDSSHVKSHLQKYRSNSKRTKEVFQEQLEAALKQACDDQINVQHSYPFPRGSKNPISSLDMAAIMDGEHDCPFEACSSEVAGTANPNYTASNITHTSHEQRLSSSSEAIPPPPPAEHRTQHQPRQHQPSPQAVEGNNGAEHAPQCHYSSSTGSAARRGQHGSLESHQQLHQTHNHHAPDNAGHIHHPHHHHRHEHVAHVHHGHENSLHHHHHHHHHGHGHHFHHPHTDDLADSIFEECLECLLSPTTECSESNSQQH